MAVTRARYDGHADWYDNWNKPHIEANGPEVIDLLGPGDGLCLDLGCGTGPYFDLLAASRSGYPSKQGGSFEFCTGAIHRSRGSELHTDPGRPKSWDVREGGAVMTRRTHLWIFVAISIAISVAVLASLPTVSHSRNAGNLASVAPRDEPYFVDLHVFD